MAVALMAPIGSGALAQALSPAVGRPLQAANSAARAGNIAAATNSVAQARAAAKSPAERRKVSEMAAYVYTRGGQFGRAAAELESVGAPASQLAPLYYQARQFDKAIAAGRRSGQLTIVGQSLLQTGRYKDAVAVYQQLASRSPTGANLSNLAGAQLRSGDRAGAMATYTRIVRLDPSPASWRRLLVDMKNSPQPAEAKLAVYHLMQMTGNLTTDADVQDFAKNAIVRGQSGFAAAVIADAAKAGVVQANDPMVRRLSTAAAQRAASELAAAPAAARNPATAVAAGHGFLGAGRFGPAAAAFAAGRARAAGRRGDAVPGYRAGARRPGSRGAHHVQPGARRAAEGHRQPAGAVCGESRLSHD
jgi:tetratricopeptide (TPR) repeat protein